MSQDCLSLMLTLLPRSGEDLWLGRSVFSLVRDVIENFSSALHLNSSEYGSMYLRIISVGTESQVGYVAGSLHSPPMVAGQASLS